MRTQTLLTEKLTNVSPPFTFVCNTLTQNLKILPRRNINKQRFTVIKGLKKLMLEFEKRIQITARLEFENGTRIEVARHKPTKTENALALHRR